MRSHRREPTETEVWVVSGLAVSRLLRFVHGRVGFAPRNVLTSAYVVFAATRILTAFSSTTSALNVGVELEIEKSAIEAWRCGVAAMAHRKDVVGVLTVNRTGAADVAGRA